MLGFSTYCDYKSDLILAETLDAVRTECSQEILAPTEHVAFKLE